MSSSVDKSGLKGAAKLATILLSIGIILLMFKSNRILYIRYLQDTHIYLLAFVLMLYYAVVRWKKLERMSMFKGICVTLLALIYIYERVMLGEMNSRGLMCMVITIFGASMIVMAPLADKRAVLKYFTFAVELILVVALIGWIPYLMGVPLPHYRDNSDVYYMHEVYYLFNTFAINGPGDLLRFAGPFLEPGHLGSMAVYLLYIEGFNLRKFGNIVLLASIFLSLSLAAYGMMVGAILIVLFEKRKYLIVGIATGVFLAIGIGATVYLNGDNVLNKAIVSRLEVTESGDIAGNNRYTSFFKSTFNKYLETNQIWTGVGKDAYATQNKTSGNLMMGNAGFKRYFYLRGIIGSALIIALLVIYIAKYMSLKSFGFLIIYVVSNLIRDYPTKEMWMYLYLLAIPVLYFEGRSLTKKQRARQKRAIRQLERTKRLEKEKENACPAPMHGPQLCD